MISGRQHKNARKSKANLYAYQSRISGVVWCNHLPLVFVEDMEEKRQMVQNLTI